MNFISKFFKNRLATKPLVFVLGAAFLFLAAPAQAHAALFGIDDLLGKALAWIIFGINYVISYLFGIAISIISYFLTVVIRINTDIVASPLVSGGFPITLALANLGFVLAIIVIAIMTILRQETYALKSTLWKLIAAAILVNFSLVICGAILNFADNLTLYFLNAMNPSSGESNAVVNIHGFAKSMANAFGPQAVFISAQVSTSTNTVASGGISVEQIQGSSFSSILVTIMNLFFPTIFLILSVIALGGLLIMLLVRYIYLGILLILMPMAWLLWILPITSSQWRNWWEKFIKWTMFAPIVMFFLYLAILTVAGNGNASVSAYGDPEIARSLANIGFMGQLLAPMLQMATMVGLVFAGLFTAEHMGITFAKSTLAGATAVTSGLGGFVKRRGKLIGGAAMDKLKVKEGATALQTGAGARLMNVGKGRGIIGKTLTAPVRAVGFGIGMAGRGMEAVHTMTREEMVDDAKKRLGNETADQLAHGMSTFTSPEKIAALTMLRERGALDKLGDRLEQYMDEEMFRTFNQDQTAYKDLNKAWLSNKAMRDAARGSGGGISPELMEAARSYVVDLKPADIGKGKNWDDLLSEGSYGDMDANMKRNFNIAQIRAMAEMNPNLLTPIISQLRGKNLQRFQGLFDVAIAGLEENKKVDLEKKFGRMIYYNMFGHHESGGETQGQPPTTPAAGGGH